MAKKGTTSNGSNSFGGYVFINVPLNASDVERVAALLPDFTNCLTELLAVLDEGYKLSHSYDAKNHSYIASLTDSREDSVYHKHTLSGRGSSPFKALVALYYKHVVVAQQDWGNLAKPNATGSADFA